MLQPTKVLGDPQTMTQENVTAAMHVVATVNNPSISLLKNQLKVTVPNSVEVYGSELQNLSNQFSENLSNIKISEAGEIGSKINNLLITTKSLDTKALLNEPNFFEKMFSKGKNKVQEFQNKQKTVAEALDKIGKDLLKDQTKLLDENTKLFELLNMNKQYTIEFKNLILAGKERLEELENEIKNMENDFRNVQPSPEEYTELQKLKNYTKNLSVKVANFEIGGALVERRNLQIMMMMDNNASEAENIQSTISIGVPAWRESITLAISQLMTKNAVDNRAMINKSINETILANSKLLGENTVAIAQAANDTTISINTLAQVNNDLISSFEKLKQINAEGAEKRKAITGQIATMNEDIKKSFLGR